MYVCLISALADCTLPLKITPTHLVAFARSGHNYDYDITGVLQFANPQKKIHTSTCIVCLDGVLCRP